MRPDFSTPPSQSLKGRPSTASQKAQSARLAGFNEKPLPRGPLPVTHTENGPSLITQSAGVAPLPAGRSPKRLPPRNWPLTVTSLFSNGDFRFTSSWIAEAAGPRGRASSAVVSEYDQKGEC